MQHADALRVVLDRLSEADGSSATFHAHEIARWPPGAYEALLRAGLLKRAQRADSVTCCGCELRCHREVYALAGNVPGRIRFVATCELRADVSATEIASGRLRRWRTTSTLWVDFVARELGLQAVNREGAYARVRLGTWKQGTFRRAVSLEFEKTAYILIGDEKINLAELITWHDGHVHLDRQELLMRSAESVDYQVGGKRYQRSRSKQRRKTERNRRRNNDLQEAANQIKRDDPSLKKCAVVDAIIASGRFGRMNPATVARLIRVPRN